MYNSIEYKDNYLKISRSLWLYYRDETALTDTGVTDKFSGNSVSFNFKQKTTGTSGLAA